MKFILLVFLMGSVISMAAVPDLKANPMSGTNVFKIGQEGSLNVTGTLTSEIPEIKYVAYASPDGITNKEDILKLTDFILSSNESEIGFRGVNPKVYVKRVTNGNYTDLDPNENVLFAVRLDYSKRLSPGYLLPWISNGKYQADYSTALVSKEILEAMFTEMGENGKNLYLTSYGQIAYNDSGSNKYYQCGSVRSTNTNNVLTITSSTTNNSTIPADIVSAIEKGFSKGKPVSNAHILVKIES